MKFKTKWLLDVLPVRFNNLKPYHSLQERTQFSCTILVKNKTAIILLHTTIQDAGCLLCSRKWFIVRECLRLCPVLSSSKLMGFEPSTYWEVGTDCWSPTTTHCGKILNSGQLLQDYCYNRGIEIGFSRCAQVCLHIHLSLVRGLKKWNKKISSFTAFYPTTTKTGWRLTASVRQWVEGLNLGHYLIRVLDLCKTTSGRSVALTIHV